MERLRWQNAATTMSLPLVIMSCCVRIEMTFVMRQMVERFFRMWKEGRERREP